MRGRRAERLGFGIPASLHGAPQTENGPVFVIDTGDLSSSGTLHIDLTLDAAAGAIGGNFEIYGKCQTIGVGAPLTSAGKVAAGSTATLIQPFLPGDQFQLEIVGDSDSSPNTKTNLSIKVSVQ